MNANNYSLATDASAPPGDDRAQTLASLAHMLDFAPPGRFTLGFAKCNLPAQRQALVEDLKAALAPLGVNLIEIDLSEPTERLLPVLQERLSGSYLPVAALAHGELSVREGGPRTALFVYGLERSLPSREADAPLLDHLNLSRELFRREVPYPLVIWLPDYALTAVARGAPDFWAWRSGVYEFPVEGDTSQRISSETLYLESRYTSNIPEGARREQLHLLQRLLDDYEELEDKPATQQTRGHLLFEIGNIQQDLGQWQDAHHAYHASLALYQATSDRANAAGVINNLGLIAQNTGDLDEARRLAEQSLVLERELGDKDGISRSLHQLGILAHRTGDLEEARRLYEQSLALKRELGNKSGIASSLHQLATLAQDTGDLNEARRLYKQSLEIEQELGNKSGIATTLFTIGLLDEQEGHLTDALRHMQQAQALWSQLGSPRAEAASDAVARLTHAGQPETSASDASHAAGQ